MTARCTNSSSQLRRSLVASGVAFLLALGVASCGSSPTEPEFVVDTGTVEFLDVEGGCWVIEGSNDTYEPTNLPASFQEDGLGVTFLGRLSDSQGSVCQVGPRIDLVSIELFGN